MKCASAFVNLVSVTVCRSYLRWQSVICYKRSKILHFIFPTFARIVFSHKKKTLLIPDYNKVQSVLSFHCVAEENSLKESLEMTSKQAILRSKICLSDAL